MLNKTIYNISCKILVKVTLNKTYLVYSTINNLVIFRINHLKLMTPKMKIIYFIVIMLVTVKVIITILKMTQVLIIKSKIKQLNLTINRSHLYKNKLNLIK